jgi:hypothetical protein
MRRQALILLACLCCAGAAWPAEHGPEEGDGWQAFVSPGPVISGHTPPVYTAGQDGTIVRKPEAEDQARLGFGAFVTLYHAETWDWLGISAGVGLDSDMQTRIYLGPSYRFGKRGAITGGVAFGPVPRLPAHLNEGDPYPTTAIEWESRIEAGWYVAFTWVAWDSLKFQGE